MKWDSIVDILVATSPWLLPIFTFIKSFFPTIFSSFSMKIGNEECLAQADKLIDRLGVDVWMLVETKVVELSIYGLVKKYFVDPDCSPGLC